MVTWEDLGMIERKNQKYNIPPFWPIHIDQSTQQTLIEQFQKSIYPIWKSIEHRLTKDGDWNEVDLLHKQDWAIYDSGNRVNRLFIPIEQLRKAEKKDRMASQFKEAME